MQSLCDTIKLLGCFSSETELLDSSDFILAIEEPSFHNLFTGNVLKPLYVRLILLYIVTHILTQFIHDRIF